MRKLFSFFSLFIFALLFCACSFLGDAQKTGSVSFCIGDGVYSKISASRAADENTEGEYYLQVSLNGGYSEEKTMPIHENTIRAIMTFGDIPEGAEVWAYALIYKVFNGEKEYILEGTSEEITIAEGENALSITMTSYKGGGNKIGSKTRPTAVGDIVFSDGSASIYTEMLTEEQKAKAIAVIFYAGSSSDTLGVRTLGVGLLNTTEKQWTINSTLTAIDAIKASSNSTGASTAGTTTFTGDSDGSDNWTKLCAAVSDASESGKYPAWEWANAYASSNSITGNYASGWYMPSLAELCVLYRVAIKESSTSSIINPAISSLGGNQISSSGDYWTSSLSSIPKIYHVDFANASIGTIDSTSETKSVLVIHAF